MSYNRFYDLSRNWYSVELDTLNFIFNVPVFYIWHSFHFGIFAINYCYFSLLIV